MKYKIYIVEDEIEIANTLKSNLIRFDFNVTFCTNFSNIMEDFKRIKPHIVLMDVNLPMYDGFYWCNQIRKISSCPILFLSARDADNDQIMAIHLGADDYITKPFSLEVVLAKVNAIIRRQYGEYALKNSMDINCLDCIFSSSKLTLSCNQKSLDLTKNEAGVIRLLFRNYPNVVSRTKLLQEIWDEEFFVEENTLNVVISRVRKKLSEVNSNIKISSVRGVGYRIGVEKNED